MSLIATPNLEWTLRRRWIGPFSILLIVLVIVIAGVLVHWKRQVDAELERREGQLERMVSLSLAAPTRRTRPMPARSATATRQISEQVALLNRDWVQLLKAVTPQRRDVKLLGMDINPGTGAIRVSGRATTAAIANAFAESLEQRGDRVQRVRLLVLGRKPDGVDFEVSAQWAQ